MGNNVAGVHLPEQAVGELRQQEQEEHSAQHSRQRASSEPLEGHRSPRPGQQQSASAAAAAAAAAMATQCGGSDVMMDAGGLVARSLGGSVHGAALSLSGASSLAGASAAGADHATALLHAAEGRPRRPSSAEGSLEASHDDPLLGDDASAEEHGDYGMGEDMGRHAQHLAEQQHQQLPRPPRASAQELRPPPLRIDAALPSQQQQQHHSQHHHHHSESEAEARGSSGGGSGSVVVSAAADAGDSARGAHVDVAVFKYQPGVQVPAENFHTYRVNLRGAALTGGLMPPTGGGDAPPPAGASDIAGEYERHKSVTLERHFIKDHRAKQLLVVPSDDKFVAVAAPEAFSRHSGTCMILGGQGAYAAGPSKSYELRVGSFLRIGSVGVVVSETHTGPGGVHRCLSWEELTCLKGDIASIQKDMVTEEALTAQEEGGVLAAAAATLAASLSPGSAAAATAAAAERRMCYMCFDDEDEAANPLVAPCECKGDTRYVHLNCLQRWHTTTSENKVCVVLNNKGVRVCTVCKSPYKASVRLPSGESVSLFHSPLPPPYICFMVVTKHQNSEDLFSTKYQLSFSSVVNRSGAGASRGLVVGRSRQCDMVLDYRTVSTRHAMIKFGNGGFHFSDLMSSNGSYLYLREPLQLPYGETVFLKWGSNVVSLKAKRSIRHRLSTLVGRRTPVRGSSGGASGTSAAATVAADYAMLESLCELGHMSLAPPVHSVDVPSAGGAAAAVAAGAVAAVAAAGQQQQGEGEADAVSMVSLD